MKIVIANRGIPGRPYHAIVGQRSKHDRRGPAPDVFFGRVLYSAKHLLDDKGRPIPAVRSLRGLEPDPARPVKTTLKAGHFVWGET